MHSAPGSTCQGGGLLGLPGRTWGDCRVSTEARLHSGSTKLRGHTPRVHCECGRLEGERGLRIAAQSHSLSVPCSEPASAFPSEAAQPLPWPAGPTQSGSLLAPALVHSLLLQSTPGPPRSQGLGTAVPSAQNVGPGCLHGSPSP